MTRKPGIFASAAIAAVVVASSLGAALGQTQSPTSLGFKKRFVIELTNPSPLELENRPVVLSVAEVRAFAPDFNSSNYAIFDESGGAYRLVVSQTDALDQDRSHQEIVFLRSLAPSSTTRLACYYSPLGTFQLMVSSPKANARLLSGGLGRVLAGWESNLAGFKFVDGRIETYGKLYPGLVLTKAVAEDAKLQEWGLNILAGGRSLGLGGLSVWEGGAAIPLAAAGAGGDFAIRRTVVAAGPLRALVRIEYAAAKPGSRGDGIILLLSAFADNICSRQDISLGARAAGPAVCGVSVQKLTGEEVSFDQNQGCLAAWGRGAEGLGEIGLAALFTPSDLAGLDENGPGRTLKLNIRPGRKLTVWTVGGWERGIVTAAVPAATNWARQAKDLGLRLRVPVEVRFKAK